MNLLGIHLNMLIGETVPVIAPLKVNEALQSVEVTHSDQGRSGFQLTFQIGRGPLDMVDYSLLKNPLLKPFNRVILTVFFNLTPYVLMDGIITNQQISPSNEPGASTLTLTGEDISILMDLEDKLVDYPVQDDNLIVLNILKSYIHHGLIPDVRLPSTIDPPSPLERTPNQHSTDLAYINTLAERHGYVFYITPGPAPLLNTAYWGPPDYLDISQPALSVNMGPYTNVNSINFQYNGLAPNKVTYKHNDTEQTVERITRTPLLAGKPAPLKRTAFFSGTDRLNTRQVEIRAQAMVNKSLDEVVTASGELDALAYGRLLQSRGKVDLRGVGQSYDGTYYVKSVSHKINVRGGEYKQSFSLTREGLGTLSPFVRI